MKVEQEWAGMPEFVQEDRRPVQKIVVNFLTREDVEAFGVLLGVPFTPKSKSVWFPPKPRDNMRFTAYLDHDDPAE